MKIWINGRYSKFYTFTANYLTLGLIWEFIELMIYGETKPSLEDTVIGILVCLVVTFCHNKEEAQ